MNYIQRQIEKIILKNTKIFPAISITGPRQSGKSTTLKEMFKDAYRYITFDDPLKIDFLNQDPKGFMNKYNNKVIFDEAQKAPVLFNYLKIAIDNDRQNYGKFILTGSSQFSFIKQITESLAGRIGSLSLLPFSLYELPHEFRDEQIFKGSYPELIQLNYENSNEWYGAYINNYVERDVRNLSNIGNLQDFQRFIKLLAVRASQELNTSSFANDIGVTVKTIQSWISILEASYIIFLVPPYFNNLGKRIIKRPKFYFYDTGLICYFAGIDNKESLRNGPLDGAIFENYVVSETKKLIFNNGLRDQMHYLRTNSGIEIDLILENLSGESLQLIEIKSTETPRIEMFNNIRKYKKIEQKSRKLKRKVSEILIYRGETMLDFREDSVCLNYFDLDKIL